VLLPLPGLAFAGLIVIVAIDDRANNVTSNIATAVLVFIFLPFPFFQIGTCFIAPQLGAPCTFMCVQYIVASD
jgi:hypothetical protein